MAKVGYRRVSTTDQNFDRQALEGCDKVFEEKVSGATRDRAALNDLIAWVREGDEVVVWSIDRLARDLRDLQEVVSALTAKGVTVSFVSERLTFTGRDDDALSRLQLQMMGAFAEFERNIIRRRQAEGIAKAKARGVYKGRKATVDAAAIRQMRAEGLGATAIAEMLGVARATVYRIA